ncbi:Uncharacterised protein [Candidatus Burarchaeum australiense]|nr:Uncharacterised protein [Candidatus Burarchaeum australiense]
MANPKTIDEGIIQLRDLTMIIAASERDKTHPMSGETRRALLQNFIDTCLDLRILSYGAKGEELGEFSKPHLQSLLNVLDMWGKKEGAVEARIAHREVLNVLGGRGGDYALTELRKRLNTENDRENWSQLCKAIGKIENRILEKSAIQAFGTLPNGKDRSALAPVGKNTSAFAAVVK